MTSWLEQETDKTQAALAEVEAWIATGVVDLGLGADFVARATKLADRLEGVFESLPKEPPAPTTTATVEFEETVLVDPRRRRADTRAGQFGELLLTFVGLAGRYGDYLKTKKVITTTKTVNLPKPMLPGSGPVRVEVSARKVEPASARPPAGFRARLRRSWLRLRGRARDESRFELVEKHHRISIAVPGIPFDPDPVVRAYEVKNLRIYRDRLQIGAFLEEYEEKVEKLSELTRWLEGAASDRGAEIEALDRSTNSGADFDRLREELAETESELPALEGKVNDLEGRLGAALSNLGGYLPDDGAGPRGTPAETGR